MILHALTVVAARLDELEPIEAEPTFTPKLRRSVRARLSRRIKADPAAFGLSAAPTRAKIDFDRTCYRHHVTTCERCNAPMIAFRFWNRETRRHLDKPRHCSDECKAGAEREKRRRYIAERRAEHGRPSRAKPPESRVCAQCGQTFTPTRSDARYCSGTCRQRAHRAQT